ncbi:Protein of unknown function [Amphibacillus marinus]|uniref:DUF2634 domain-containing protein n=1 Tax=Amphibacillus marinus TaxID=872970 RepID=A0A1H8IY64_9BACI|nr:DUF2634 domain-containing protein [Amphibacillus marinus]SEN73442.1 Protein of unknown function [Amphibacillus marinus]
MMAMELHNEEIEETLLPSRTYAVYNNRIIGTVDGIKAIRQAVEKILRTQLFNYEIYTETYGIESDRLIGQNFDFVRADIQRTIEDALLIDDRIEEINDFRIISETRNALAVGFTVLSIEGLFPIESEVQM